MPKILSLYLDDSGTRNPDHRPQLGIFRDWFALGGFIVKEEDEDDVRKIHADFCKRWNINYPLRSYNIRAQIAEFGWLALDEDRKIKFLDDLSATLTKISVIGHGCVIDRPGYNHRYRARFGRNTWQLCQTAFAVACERAAKYARRDGRKLRVYVEQGDKTADTYIRGYYASLRQQGMPFGGEAMAGYEPLTAAELKETLYDLKFKSKSSALAQIADLYTYPLARAGYQEYPPFQQLSGAKRLLDNYLTADEIPHLGIKYSCFDLVEYRRA